MNTLNDRTRRSQGLAPEHQDRRASQRRGSGLGRRWLAGLGGVALLLGACTGDDNGESGASATEMPGSASATASASASDTDTISTSGSGGASAGDLDTGPSTTGLGSSTDPSEPTTTDATSSTTEAGDFACFNSPEGPCCDPSEQWPGELRAHKVTLDVTVNGAPHKSSIYDDADIYLVNETTGDRAYFGRVSGGLLSGVVLEGTYRVSYEARGGALSVPINRRAIIGDPVYVSADDETTTPINIVSLDVELDLTVNGAVPGSSVYDDGLITVSLDGGAERTIVGKTSETANGTINAKLVAGDYVFFYESEDRGVTMPHNTLAILDERTFVRGEEGADDEYSASLAIDVPVVTMVGKIDFDGKPPPKSAFDYGHIYLRDVATESVTQIADTREGVIKPVPVIADGDYDLFYGAEMVGPVAPANRWGRLNTAMIMNSDAPLTGSALTELTELSLPIMAIEGSITIDSESKPVDPENRGELLFGDGAGDRGELGDVSIGIKSNLLRGDYDVFFRHDVSDGGLPANTFGQVSGESVKADTMQPLAIDVKTTALAGTITIGGKTPPLSVYDDGEIYLRNAAGDRVYLGRTRAGAYSRRVVEGTYDVYYAVVNTQGGVPANGETLVLEGLVIAGEEQAENIDIEVVTVGDMSLPKLPTNSGQARFFLRNVETDDEVFVGKAGETKKIMVLRGKYELVYRLETLGLGTPRNDGAVLACYSSEL